MKKVKDSKGIEYDVLAELGLVSCVRRVCDDKFSFNITWMENDDLDEIETCDKCGHKL